MNSPLELQADIFKALSHPNRIRILKLLRDKEMCNCELGPSLDLEQSNLSRHVAVLVQAGIIKPRKEGIKTFYRVVDRSIFVLLDSAQEMIKKQAIELAGMFED